MPDLIARYDDRELPVLDVVDGTPLVFHRGRIHPATDVTVGGYRLDGIALAPAVVAAPAGLVAEFEFTDGVTTTVETYPVLALLLGRSGWGDAWVGFEDEVDLVSERSGGSFRLLRFRYR